MTLSLPHSSLDGASARQASSLPTAALRSLRAAASPLSTGAYPRDSAVGQSLVRALLRAWPDLHGAAARSMRREALGEQMSDLAWHNPLLTFAIEHVERVGCSEAGTLSGDRPQLWQVDVQDGVAWIVRDKPLVLPHKEDAVELAIDLVRRCEAGEPSAAIVRKRSGVIAIRPGNVEGLDIGGVESLAGRHQRFRSALEKAMEKAGFVRVAPYRFERSAL